MVPREPLTIEACVEEALAAVGERVVLATPLGLGKPNHLLNEIYRRAKEDRGLDLRILTALTLVRPRPASELERRLVEPLAERLFGDYPDLGYALDRLRGELPPNVEVREFYFTPGTYLNLPRAQRDYVSSNYTHVVRDALDAGVNMVAQMVAPPPADGSAGGRYSLSSNPDLTLDLVPRMRRRGGGATRVIAQTNLNLPFMGGDAAVEPSFFDAVVDDPALAFDLFGPPNEAVSTADYFIGLHASALVRDGGTLQLGIGAISDAVAHMLLLRHEHAAEYRALLENVGALAAWGDLIAGWGGTEAFEEGLYANSEMLVEGFLHLLRRGVLKRRVFAHPRLERLVAAGRVAPRPEPETLRVLAEEGIDPAELATGRLAHAGFFLGPRSFYRALREMEPAQRQAIAMTRISFVNDLYSKTPGGEELKRLQRRHARFLNTGLKATLGGAVASDGLEDGRVLSGVGGQYNFVAMAQDLEDGRSILMLRSTRESGGEVESNILASYGHVTIPRHLRDIVVTEYGIADVRGKSDGEIARALIAISDSRFQEDLVAQARRGGKLASDYRLPERHRANLPERLEALRGPLEERELLPDFPFGTDLTDEEVILARALRQLKKSVEQRRFPLAPLAAVVSPPEAARPYLERMGLARPKTLRERLLAAAVRYALAASGAPGAG